MSEWKKVRLDHIGRVVTGKTPKTSVSDFWNGDVPFVTPGDIQSSKHISNTARYVTKEGLSSVKGAAIPRGAICVSCIGVLGYTAITERECITNQQINSLIVNNEFDVDFIYYALRNSWNAFKNMEGFSSVVSILNKSTFSEIELSLPPVLSSLDDKIENNRKICANLEAQAQAIFKSWFVDFEPFGGKMPQGWKMGKLGDIIESMLNGDWGKDTPDDKNDSPVYCVRGADIPDVVCGNKGKMPLRYILPKNYETKQLANGDVVIEISGGSPTQSTGRAALITDSLLERYDRGMVCTNFCKAVKPRDGFSFLFYNYWCYLYNKGVFFQYENGTTGIKNLDIRTALNELDVVLPVAGALSKFTDIVSTNFKLICKLGLETEKLAALRDALLPKLMSGEIDVEKVKISA